MKNIHILPTDKPSRLFIHNAFNDLRLDSKNVLHDNNQNLYITSDEEIKEGDWIYYTSAIGYCKTTVGSKGLEQEGIPAKKIILTTDQDLDGVQAIDDTFLEWFIKNPSCEKVEVEHFGTCCGNLLIAQCINCNQYNPVYKIIIPKEEPLIEFTNTNDFTSMIYNPTDEQGRLMTYWGGLEEPKTNLDRLPFPELVKELAEYYKNIPLVEETKQETERERVCNCGLKESEHNVRHPFIPRLETKQETLEEAAERYAESNQYDLECHDEGGYLGIDTKIFAKKLIDFTNKWFEQFKKK